jgi:hypothetical protein
MRSCENEKSLFTEVMVSLVGPSMQRTRDGRAAKTVDERTVSRPVRPNVQHPEITVSVHKSMTVREAGNTKVGAGRCIELYDAYFQAALTNDECSQKTVRRHKPYLHRSKTPYTLGRYTLTQSAYFVALERSPKFFCHHRSGTRSRNNKNTPICRL